MDHLERRCSSIRRCLEIKKCHHKVSPCSNSQLLFYIHDKLVRESTYIMMLYNTYRNAIPTYIVCCVINWENKFNDWGINCSIQCSNAIVQALFPIESQASRVNLSKPNWACIDGQHYCLRTTINRKVTVHQEKRITFTFTMHNLHLKAPQ